MARIHGLNDAESLTGRNMAPVGFDVRKGAEMVKGPTARENRIGRNLDYFRITAREGFERYEPVVLALLGKGPKVIKNAYMVGGVDQCFDAKYVERLSTGFTKRVCNGLLITAELTASGMEFTPRPCLKQSGQTCKCRRRANLYFYLPELIAQTGITFLFNLGTGSAEEIRNITGQLEFCQQAAGGALWRVPFTIFRKVEQVPRVGEDGQPMMVNESRVHVLGDLAGVLTGQRTLPTSVDTPQLPPSRNALPPDDSEDGDAPPWENTPAQNGTSENYWIALTNMVTARLGMTIQDLLDAFDCETPEAFMQMYATFDEAKAEVRDMAIDQQWPVIADRVEISHVRNNSNNRFYVFPVDFCDVSCGERKAFIDAGYITEADWTNTGRVRIADSGVMFTIKRNTRKNKTIYYTVDQVIG